MCQENDYFLELFTTISLNYSLLCISNILFFSMLPIHPVKHVERAYLTYTLATGRTLLPTSIIIREQQSNCWPSVYANKGIGKVTTNNKGCIRRCVSFPFLTFGFNFSNWTVTYVYMFFLLFTLCFSYLNTFADQPRFKETKQTRFLLLHIVTRGYKV